MCEKGRCQDDGKCRRSGQCLRGTAGAFHDLGFHFLNRWPAAVERALHATRLQPIKVYQGR